MPLREKSGDRRCYFGDLPPPPLIVQCLGAFSFYLSTFVSSLHILHLIKLWLEEEKEADTDEAKQLPNSSIGLADEF
jgi:hypothetical protein